MHQQLTRRDVIKTVLVATATSVIGGKAWAAKTVSDVTASAIDPTVGVARVLLSAFPALNNNGGSVRLGSSNISGNFPLGLFYPIIISRVSATEYAAVESACTHEGCVVAAFVGSATAGRMTCPCHGSQFDIHGNVLQGPAAFPLLKYQTSVGNGLLTIQIPDAGFTVTQNTVLNGAEQRLELVWDALDRVEYEVRYRPNFATEPVRVNCSLTLAGATTSTFVPGLANGGTRKVYVIPQDGIYQVAIRMRAV
jgi:Rieske Fe-S protein